ERPDAGLGLVDQLAESLFQLHLAPVSAAPRPTTSGRLATVTLSRRLTFRAADLVLEHLPMIPVLQPPDFYGFRRSVDWSPYPITCVDLRRYNLRAQRG